MTPRPVAAADPARVPLRRALRVLERPSQPAEAPSTQRQARSLALDAYRGIAIAAMILVNTPGSASHRYAAVRHADWHGWALPDLLFPAFLFVVGMSIVLSFGRTEHAGAPLGPVMTRVVKRAVLLFAIGLLLNAFPTVAWPHLRVLGVLQRIALCYLLASIAVLTLTVRAQAVLAVALVLAHTLLLRLSPIAGGSAAWLGPETNLGAVVDRALLGGHLLHAHWDPEGLLGTIPATATVLAGVLVGHWWVSRRSLAQRLAGMFGVGILAIAAGLLAGVLLPINKSLWTGSFVVFTAGTSLIGLALCAWLIDLCRVSRWATPFVVFGTNSLLAYVVSVLADKALLSIEVAMPGGSLLPLKSLIYEAVFLRVASGPRASLLYAFTWLVVCFVPFAVLYRRRIFVKL